MLGTKYFSEFDKGLLYSLLNDSYLKFPELSAACHETWKEFDSFVFDNLSFMDHCGFVSVLNETPIGFMSWDPRNSPVSVQVGHNCIINEYKGKGYGRSQLSIGMNIIKSRKPERIIVKTGNINFFIPAQRMYCSAGFIQKQISFNNDPLVPELIEYEMIVDGIK